MVAHSWKRDGRAQVAALLLTALPPALPAQEDPAFLQLLRDARAVATAPQNIERDAATKLYQPLASQAFELKQFEIAVQAGLARLPLLSNEGTVTDVQLARQLAEAQVLVDWNDAGDPYHHLERALHTVAQLRLNPQPPESETLTLEERRSRWLQTVLEHSRLSPDDAPTKLRADIAATAQGSLERGLAMNVFARYLVSSVRDGRGTPQEALAFVRSPDWEGTPLYTRERALSDVASLLEEQKAFDSARELRAELLRQQTERLLPTLRGFLAPNIEKLSRLALQAGDFAAARSYARTMRDATALTFGSESEWHKRAIGLLTVIDKER